MRVLLRLVCIVALAVALTTCASESQPPGTVTVALGLDGLPGGEGDGEKDDDSQVEPTEDSPHTPVDLISQGDATLLPYVEPMRRARQRMTIDQLSQTLDHVTGGIGWAEMQGGQPIDLFETFAATLGVPDYIETTQEDLSASALFHKFLDEAARYACSELVDRETSGEPIEAHLMVHTSPEATLAGAPDAIDKNLRYLLLRYHGRKVVGDAPALNGWRWLFESVSHVSGDPAIGWRSVCIGLISHPDFYSF